MLKLKRLRIDKFRNVTPGTEIRFSDGANVLLGQNGTGKTTLLELISMVVRSNFESVAKEELAVEYDIENADAGSMTIVVRNERVQDRNPLGIDQANSRHARSTVDGLRTTAEIRLEIAPGQQLVVRYAPEAGVQVGDEPPQRLPWNDTGSMGMRPMSLLLFLRGRIEKSPWDSWFFSGPRTWGAYRFDESLDLFFTITDSEDIPGTLVIYGERDVGVDMGVSPAASPLLPREVFQQLCLMYERMKSDYAVSYRELDFLSQINAVMGFMATELKVDVLERHPADQDALEWVKMGNIVFRFWWESGEFITHHRLSYGQKRLLTFYYYLACNPDFVIADELVNGLHHRWITAAVEAIGERQAFLTSQNPLLLDYVPITSPEQVRTSFVLCRSEPRDGRPGWIWENMTEADAAELFAAYEVGIEHVSEILQSRGLW